MWGVVLGQASPHPPRGRGSPYLPAARGHCPLPVAGSAAPGAPLPAALRLPPSTAPTGRAAAAAAAPALGAHGGPAAGPRTGTGVGDREWDRGQALAPGIELGPAPGMGTSNGNWYWEPAPGTGTETGNQHQEWKLALLGTGVITGNWGLAPLGSGKWERYQLMLIQDLCLGLGTSLVNWIAHWELGFGTGIAQASRPGSCGKRASQWKWGLADSHLDGNLGRGTGAAQAPAPS